MDRDAETESPLNARFVNNTWRCGRCDAEMEFGSALVSTYAGSEDDIGGCVTYSIAGPGRLVTVLKCPTCGYSFRPPTWVFSAR